MDDCQDINLKVNDFKDQIIPKSLNNGPAEFLVDFRKEKRIFFQDQHQVGNGFQKLEP